jgi:hypothetical protein
MAVSYTNEIQQHTHMSDPITFSANGAIEALCTVLLDIAKTSPSANINDVMAQVKSALDQNAKLTNALQTNTRMLARSTHLSRGLALQ